MTPKMCDEQGLTEEEGHHNRHDPDDFQDNQYGVEDALGGAVDQDMCFPVPVDQKEGHN